MFENVAVRRDEVPWPAITLDGDDTIVERQDLPWVMQLRHPRSATHQMWIGFPVTAIAASFSASLCVG